MILPGESEPLFLGDQAASVLKVLVSAKDQLGKKVAKMEPEDLKKLEKKIRTEVETELLKKFKTDKDATFKSLQQLSKSKDKQDFGTEVLSDGQFSKLSDEEQERYLSGS